MPSSRVSDGNALHLGTLQEQQQQRKVTPAFRRGARELTLLGLLGGLKWSIGTWTLGIFSSLQLFEGCRMVVSVPQLFTDESSDSSSYHQPTSCTYAIGMDRQHVHLTGRCPLFCPPSYVCNHWIGFLALTGLSVQ